MAGGLIGALGIGALGASSMMQGEQARNIAMQQLRQRQLEAQLKQMQEMQQLQANTAYQQALGQVSPDERQHLLLGGTVDQWETQALKRKQAMGEASAMADMFDQRAADGSLPIEQRLTFAKLATNLRANPELANTLKTILPTLGLGPQKQGPRTSELNMLDAARELGIKADPDSWTQEQANAIRQRVIADRQAATMAGVHPSVSTEYAGTSAFKVSRNPYTLEEYGRVPAGTIKPGVQEISALNQAETARAGIQDILTTGKKVLPGSEGLSALSTPYRLAAKGALGDPDVSDYNAAKIALIPHLRAVAGAARINQAEIDAVNGALANARTYPQLQRAITRATKLLDMATAILRKNMGMSGSSGLPPDISSVGTPVYGAGGRVTSFTPVGPARDHP